ncbi:MAG TPA: N-acetylmuramoyl-L-alanine amidase [Vicinamibacterales bacterium]|nr:N-acetylmuramoyl-L-alanine amidase [Vicinamibacterales bacterium]
MTREEEVRVLLNGPAATPAVLTDVRAVISAYEAVVKRYPASGYSDNALWQGGRLALDAFAKFNQPQDKATGVRLLRRLAAIYVTSTLAKQVPEQLARVGDAAESGGSVSSEAAGPLAVIKDIRRTVLPDAVRVTIELDAEVAFHEERIADPWRVFVDLPGTRAAASLVDQTIRFDGDGDIVRQIRIGRHPNHTTRVVLDAAGVTSYSVYPLYSPFRLVIDCVRPTLRSEASTPSFGVASRGVRPEASAPTFAAAGPAAIPAVAVPPNPPPSVAAAINPAPKIPELAAVAPIGPTTPAAPPAKNMNGGFSIARQLGLGVSRIVIDPGHGGHDPGAKGKGVTEAELVLDVALRLEKLLQKVAGVEVILTRRTDDFIPLQERTAIANREGADLFLSIHANASANATARGIETYFLNFANNLSAAAVAARENAASGQAMGSLPDLVKAIALHNKLDESKDFAAQVQKAMIERLRPANKTLKDLGVKQAPFVVLIGAAMPSVLAEISFVTNAQEAKLLKGTPYRQRIADALFNAIRKYQSSLKTTTTVALQ